MDVPFVEFVSTAEGLIEHLRPTANRWAPYPGDWIFRGQRDSRWGLLPAAFRAAAWEPFAIAGQPAFDPIAAGSTTAAEWSVLRRFLGGLDHSGLDVPNDIFVRDHIAHSAESFLEFPLQPAPLTFVALAAHHGVPTRLLDWSRLGLIAAYFAAAGAAQQHAEAPGTVRNMAVWAFRTQLPELADQRLGIQNSPGAPSIRIATAPRASNPNLHAQSGLFTESASSRVAPIEQLVIELLIRLERDGDSRWTPPPPLVRFDLPTSEAPKLLRLLSYEQVDGARMFPGRDGVVDAMREMSLWDRA